MRRDAASDRLNRNEVRQTDGGRTTRRGGGARSVSSRTPQQRSDSEDGLPGRRRGCAADRGPTGVTGPKIPRVETVGGGGRG